MDLEGKRGTDRVTGAMISKYARDHGYGNIKKGSGIWSLPKEFLLEL